MEILIYGYYCCFYSGVARGGAGDDLVGSRVDDVEGGGRLEVGVTS